MKATLRKRANPGACVTLTLRITRAPRTRVASTLDETTLSIRNADGERNDIDSTAAAAIAYSGILFALRQCDVVHGEGTEDSPRYLVAVEGVEGALEGEDRSAIAYAASVAVAVCMGRQEAFPDDEFMREWEVVDVCDN